MTSVVLAGQSHGHVPQPAAGRRHVGQSEGVPEGDGPLVAQRQSPHGRPLAGEAGTGRNNLPRRPHRHRFKPDTHTHTINCIVLQNSHNPFKARQSGSNSVQNLILARPGGSPSPVSSFHHKSSEAHQSQRENRTSVDSVDKNGRKKEKKTPSVLHMWFCLGGLVDQRLQWEFWSRRSHQDSAGTCSCHY